MNLSRYRIQSVMIVATLFLVIVPRPGSAPAQDGRFIEGLFRTIAEAQSEHEQRKRAELERRQEDERRRAAEEARRRPNKLPSPGNSGVIARPPVGVPNRIPPGGSNVPTHSRHGGQTSISVQSAEAAEFVEQLVAFNGAVDHLLQDLQSAAIRTPSLRPILPGLFGVSADTRALLTRCNGLRSLQPVTDQYCELDSHWRQVSFNLRTTTGIDPEARSHIHTCDRAVSKIVRQLGITPQLDRHALHDQVIIAATNIEALMDDLSLAAISSRDADHLTQDARRLRQRLLSAADLAETATYEEFVGHFTQFAADWQGFTQDLQPISDPHIHRRLDRIRQSGDATYALLWMPPPRQDRHLQQVAHDLEQACGSLLDQLTLRTLVSLRAGEQVQVMQAARSLYDRCRELETAVQRDPGGNGIEALYIQIDREWDSLRRRLTTISTLRPGVLAGMDHHCQALRDVFGFSSTSVTSVNIEELAQAAASLEGAAEYFVADLKRFQSYMTPASYRRDLTAAADGVHAASKRLHAQLSHHESLATLQQTTHELTDQWDKLTRYIEEADRHGLAGRRAQYLSQSHGRLVPSVARIAAALMGG